MRVAKGGLHGKPQWVELEGGDLDLVVLQAVAGMADLPYEESTHSEQDMLATGRR